MIISQNRTLSAINILLVIALGSFLCIGAFFNLPDRLHPIVLEPAVSNLIGLEIGKNLSPQANVLVTLALTLLQAFLLNGIVNHFNFMGKPNFLTALMYMTLVSLFLPFLVLSPSLICNFITIWMLSKLFNINNKSDYKSLFDLGMIVALGSLVYFPFVVMLILIWIALLLFKPFRWREWVIPIIGFAIVYFLIGVVYYWLKQFNQFIAIFSPFSNAFPTTLKIDYHDYFVGIPIGITLLLFLYVLRERFYKSVVHIRKSFQLLIAMAILIVGSFYLNEMIDINHFLLCAPPVSICLAFYFSHAKTKWVYETLYGIIILTILYFHFT